MDTYHSLAIPGYFQQIEPVQPQNQNYMRLFTFLLLFALAATFTSCLDETTSLSAPGFENEPGNEQFNRVPAQPSDLVGQRFSMAEITLSAQGRNDDNFSMTGCLLSVLEDECDTECQSRIDEGGSSVAFTNSYYTRPSTEFDGIRFANNNLSSTGAASSFLVEEVLPLLTEADWVVEREGDNFVLTCTDCNIDRFGGTYTDRVIRLTR
jgi:hypothetical protein